MKPRNKFQQQVLAHSQTLSPINDKQYNWALNHCFNYHARRLKSGKTTCLQCGHSWQGNNGTLADTIVGCVCPNCSKELKVEFTQNRGIVNFARTEEKTDTHKKRWQKDNFMTNRSRNEQLN